MNKIMYLNIALLLSQPLYTIDETSSVQAPQPDTHTKIAQADDATKIKSPEDKDAKDAIKAKKDESSEKATKVSAAIITKKSEEKSKEDSSKKWAKNSASAKIIEDFLNTEGKTLHPDDIAIVRSGTDFEAWNKFVDEQEKNKQAKIDQGNEKN